MSFVNMIFCVNGYIGLELTIFLIWIIMIRF